MILKLAKKWNIDLDGSFMIGDGWKDIHAGKSAGCKTLLLDREYNKGIHADFHAETIAEAVKLIKRNDHYEIYE